MSLFFIFLSYFTFSQDTFFCIENQIFIRSEPNENSQQIGILNLYDMANIIDKTENISIINDIENNWYRILFNNIEGYVFSGYGVVLKEQYTIKTIDDFANNLPSIFQIEKSYRHIFTWAQYNENSMVRLDYEIRFMEHQFLLWLYYRPNTQANINNMSITYNLEIRNANNGFGIGSSYDVLNNMNRSLEIMTNHGNQGRHFYGNWGSSFTYDIAAFLFETELDNNFDGIIINALNLWLINNRGTNPNINNNLIINTKNNRNKEAILFQIIYEIVLRLKIE